MAHIPLSNGILCPASSVGRAWNSVSKGSRYSVHENTNPLNLPGTDKMFPHIQIFEIWHTIKSIWIYMIFVFLFWLISLCTTVSRYPHFYKWHSFISFYGWVIFHCVGDYIFFIHFSVNGHLGCFHVLAIAKSAAINIGMRESYGIMVSSQYMPGVGLQDHTVVLLLVF